MTNNARGIRIRGMNCSCRFRGKFMTFQADRFFRFVEKFLVVCAMGRMAFQAAPFLSDRIVNQLLRQFHDFCVTGGANIDDCTGQFVFVSETMVLMAAHAVPVRKRLVVVFIREPFDILRVAVTKK